MKKIYFIILSLLLTIGIFAQSGKTVNPSGKNNENDSCFINRKEKGFYNIMHVSLLLGTSQLTYTPTYYTPYDSPTTNIVPIPAYYPCNHSPLTIAPSFTTSFGHIFNKHWTAGTGVGFEIFNYNLFPVFAEVRYTLWDHKISPFVALNAGYSFASFKSKHYDELYLDWPPYNIDDARLRNYGGFMFNPEVGVKVPLNENSDLLFTVAYRYQKTKSVARKEYNIGQFDEWEHNEEINRLSFGIAIMFR